MTATFLPYLNISGLSVKTSYLLEITYSPIVSLIPLSTVEQFALEVIQARNFRPLPVIQRTGCGYQYIAKIRDHVTILEVLDLYITLEIKFHRSYSIISLYLDLPLSISIIPHSFRDLVIEFDISHRVILGHHFLPVLVDLLGCCIKLRPFVVRLKSGLVSVCRYIARTSGVAIFKPRPTYI